eukprot:1326423-Amphidinium_carterae.1
MSLLWPTKLLLLCYACGMDMVAGTAIVISVGAGHSISFDDLNERHLVDVVVARSHASLATV